MTFQPGDRVHVVTSVSSAVVLEQDGDLVYVGLPNGVEMEYDVSAIIYEDDHISLEELVEILKEEEQAKVEAELSDIWNAVDSRLQALTMLYYQNTTKILSSISPAATSTVEAQTTWDDVSSFQRLNILAVLTSISVAMWKNAYENDKMSRLTLTAYAGIVKDHESNNYG